MKLLSITHIPVHTDKVDGVVYVEMYKTFTSYTFKKSGHSLPSILDYRVSCRKNYSVSDFIRDIPKLEIF